MLNTRLVHINGFDDLTLKCGAGVFIGFDIIFIKMFLLKCTVKSNKGFIFNFEGKAVISNIDCALQAFRRGAYQLQGRL